MTANHSEVLEIAINLLFLVVLVGVFRYLPLSQLIQYRKTQHLVFGACACVFILWLFRTGILPQMEVHFLWLTALTLLLGFKWAMFSGLVALIFITVIGIEPWDMLAANGLLSVTLPITISYLIYAISFYRLPRHSFVYIFVCAFLGGMLSITLKMLGLAVYYHYQQGYLWPLVLDNYLALIPFMILPEAMLNGMTITLLVMYCPSWVYTFHQKYRPQDKS